MKIFIIIFLSFLSLMVSCTKSQELFIEITNSLDQNRANEMIEIELSDIKSKLNLADGEEFVITNDTHQEIPYQITYDQKVIFLVNLEGQGRINLRVIPGIPHKPMVVCCGMVYAQRYDDLAWENDMAGFRAYGPALQQKGEKAFGYDLFAKRNTQKPVLEGMYALETDKITWSEIRALREVDPKAAEELRRSVTYHVDKGYGMDCYAVGPTLGAGVAALLNNNEIVYPWCYSSCQILDNGPIRFTAKLKFTPMLVNGDEVVETRVISLDAGSHLNKTVVRYTNLKQPMAIASGIVLHDYEGRITSETQGRFMAYEDPTTGPNQGKLFLGHVFPQTVKEIKTLYFSEEEVVKRNTAKGHLLASDTIYPNGEFCYYWGFGWSKSDIKNNQSWIDYLANFSKRLSSPLNVDLK